jgi:ribosomal protein S15P/S13E
MVKETETKEEVKKLSQEEYEKKVLELAKTGLTSEKIGEKLRREGIHPQEFKGKISQILKEQYVNPDLKNVNEKFTRIQQHYEKNNQDKRAKREKDRFFSKLRKIKLYLGMNPKTE